MPSARAASSPVDEPPYLKSVTEKTYSPQLDALRAFAILAVIWHHWLPDYGFGLPLASGVQLFFVLSGFLITRILLVARNDAKQGAIRNRRVLLAFYARRFLRIFPIYGAVILLAITANVADLRISYPWHLTFTSNYYFILQQGWHQSVAPFWSLAVEEQFYLFWPLATLFLPRKSIPPFFIFMVLLGPAYRACCGYFFPDVRMLSVATPGSFDSLALGALLAWGQLNPGAWFERFAKNSRAIALLAVAAYIGLLFVPDGGIALHGIYGNMLLSVAFVVFVHHCSQGVSGRFGSLLNNRVLRYIGTISYCLYLVHNLSWIPGYLLRDWIPQLSTNFYGALAFRTFVTFGFAALSWHFFEKPINSLKRHIPYVPRATSCRSDNQNLDRQPHAAAHSHTTPRREFRPRKEVSTT